MPSFFAHSGSRSDFSDWQPLATHLLNVAELARQFAREACADNVALEEQTYLAGLLHDLGKYRPGFQAMLRGCPPPVKESWHKQAGAAKAAEGNHLAAVYAIAGHHGGMPERARLKDIIRGDAGQPVARAVWADATRDCPRLGELSRAPPELDGLAAELFTRMLFSCLVDADWTDTATFYANGQRDLVPPLDPETWLSRVLAYIQDRSAACKNPSLAAIRSEILNACLTAAELPPGLFSLTVPTGGGKTLSGLAFALKHAASHGLRRVIYVAPYLSILEQNARVFRQALGFERGDPQVFEHHSLAEPPGNDDDEHTDRDDRARRAENWDAPVILTTSVQFFESLFAHRPGRCRKLHNIANSVVLLDECQTLPPDLVAPTCSMLGQLAGQFRTSIVLCTATQPAFDHPKIPERLTGVREVAPASLNLFARLRRVRVEWPKAGETLDWPGVAERMLQRHAALCIVNTRRAARELFAELRQRTGAPVLHLSTSMCPEHRLAVLDRAKKLLEANQPCYLVSTQLIEAGVDIDFPFVLREMAPLEAIIQAAGRCNREGLLNHDSGEPGGTVVVFRSLAAKQEPSRYFPRDGWYHAGRDKVEHEFLNSGSEPQIDKPDDIRKYFELLYWSGNLDKKHIQVQRGQFHFPNVACEYRLIDDEGVPVVVATWQEHEEEIAKLLGDVRLHPSRAAYRKLSPFQVNLRQYELANATLVGEEQPGLFVWRGEYDPDLGFKGDSADVLLIV